MGGLYRKKKGKSACRERLRIEWEEYIGRKEESLQEEKDLGLNGRISKKKKGKSAGIERPRFD
jgi:hypothetical protein